MNPRILIPLAVLFVTVPAAAKEGVQVKIVRLEGAPDRLAGRDVRVAVSIGGKHLYDTPAVPAAKAAWNRSLRAWTATNRPLVFRVSASGGVAPAAEPARREVPPPAGTPDDTLSAGFEDLVADYGTGSLDEGAESDARARARRAAKRRQDQEEARDAARDVRARKADGRRTTVCKASLAWPPAEGEHRLDCAGMTLVVRTGKP